MSDKTEVLRGAAVLAELLDMIGADSPPTDSELARVVTDNELQLRGLLEYVLTRWAFSPS